MLGREDYTHQDKERLAASFALAMGIHIMLFTVFAFINWEDAGPQPDITGPVYITLNTPTEELKLKEKSSVAKTEPAPEKPVEKIPPKKQEQKKAPPVVKKSETRINEPPKPPVKSDAKKTEKVQQAETQVTKPEAREYQVPTESEKVTTGDKTVVTGEEAEQEPPVSGILESDKLSQLEKVLDQSKDVSAYSGKTTGNQQVTNSNSPKTSSSSNKGAAGPVSWEDPGEARNPIAQPEPIIPDWVAKQGIQLKAEYAFVVTPEGFLTNIRRVRSSGYTDVDQAIEAALRRWQFQPTSSGKSAKATVPYTIQPN